MVKKTFQNSLLLLLLTLLSAYSQPPSDAIRMGLSSSAVNLDPRFATDATSTRINRLLYQRLVEFDQSSLPIPSLARWQQLTPTHYRFTLQGGNHFSNGQPLTASDVAATFQSILNPATVSPHRTTLNMVQQIEVIDAKTIDFRLNHPDPLLPAYLSIGILPADAIRQNHPFHRQPLGSGAFKFIAWPSEGKLQLERLSDQQKISFITVKDPTVRVLKLLRGEIDLLQNDLPTELLGYLKAEPDITISQGRGSNFLYLGFNMQDPATGNLLIRQAVAHAVDRQAIIHHLFDGAATPAQALFPPWHWAGTSLPAIPHDPTRAKTLLAAAGYNPANPLKLTYKTSSDPFRIRIATIIQQQLAEVGIELDVRSFDWGTFYGDIKAGRFQLYSLAWVGIKTPDVFRYIFASESIPPNGANRGRFNDPVSDRLITEAAHLPSPEAQAVVYHQLQQRLLEQLPYVPLWYEDQLFVSRADITGYHLAEDGNYDGLKQVKRVKHASKN
ncbi:MAG: ABC transporter substrate-binding protein [Candidatus Polarisedimenticolaceae bacterium]|nr:ABC transporter substrate-binding protein [Candidatus Polarisedimenticolaceae bacterium]